MKRSEFEGVVVCCKDICAKCNETCGNFTDDRCKLKAAECYNNTCDDCKGEIKNGKNRSIWKCIKFKPKNGCRDCVHISCLETSCNNKIYHHIDPDKDWKECKDFEFGFKNYNTGTQCQKCKNWKKNEREGYCTKAHLKRLIKSKKTPKKEESKKYCKTCRWNLFVNNNRSCINLNPKLENESGSCSSHGRRYWEPRACGFCKHSLIKEKDDSYYSLQCTKKNNIYVLGHYYTKEEFDKEQYTHVVGGCEHFQNRAEKEKPVICAKCVNGIKTDNPYSFKCKRTKDIGAGKDCVFTNLTEEKDCKYYKERSCATCKYSMENTVSGKAECPKFDLKKSPNGKGCALNNNYYAWEEYIKEHACVDCSYNEVYYDKEHQVETTFCVKKGLDGFNTHVKWLCPEFKEKKLKEVIFSRCDECFYYISHTRKYCDISHKKCPYYSKKDSSISCEKCFYSTYFKGECKHKTRNDCKNHSMFAEKEERKDLRGIKYYRMKSGRETCIEKLLEDCKYYEKGSEICNKEHDHCDYHLDQMYKSILKKEKKKEVKNMGNSSDEPLKRAVKRDDKSIKEKQEEVQKKIEIVDAELKKLKEKREEYEREMADKYKKHFKEYYGKCGDRHDGLNNDFEEYIMEQEFPDLVERPFSFHSRKKKKEYNSKKDALRTKISQIKRWNNYFYFFDDPRLERPSRTSVDNMLKDQWKIFAEVCELVKKYADLFELKKLEDELCKKTKCAEVLHKAFDNVEDTDGKCPECKSELRKDGNFCTFCGWKVSK